MVANILNVGILMGKQRFVKTTCSDWHVNLIYTKKMSVRFLPNRTLIFVTLYYSFILNYFSPIASINAGDGSKPVKANSLGFARNISSDITIESLRTSSIP